MSIDFQWHYDYARIAWDSGFCFDTYKSQQKFDRNGIALVDIEQIIRDRDINSVDRHIHNILEYKLDIEDSSILNSNFLKLFRLSQLAIEFLIYCKKYLDSTLVVIKKDLETSNNENDKLKQELFISQSELIKVKKKNKDLKYSLEIHQKYVPRILPNNPINEYLCSQCNKTFLNEEYLKAHNLRRHSLDVPVPTNQIDNTQYQKATEQLHMEIKELKEKLNNTERYFKNENNQKFVHAENENTEKLSQRFDVFQKQLETDLQHLKLDKDNYEKLTKMIIDKIDVNYIKTKCDLHVQDVEIQTNGLPDSKLNRVSNVEVKSAESNDVHVENLPAIQPINIETDISKVKEEIEKVVVDKAKEDIKILEVQLSEQLSTIYTELNERFDKFRDKIKVIEERELRFIDSKAPTTIPEKYNEPIQITNSNPETTIHSTNSDIKISPKTQEIHSNISEEVKNISSSDLSEIETESESSSDDPVPNKVKPDVKIVKIHDNQVKSNARLKVKRLGERVIFSQYQSDIESESEYSQSESDKSEQKSSPPVKELKSIIKTKPMNETFTIKERREVNNIQKTNKQNKLFKSTENITKTPETIETIRETMETDVNNKFQKIGIDPMWTRLPDKSFKQKSDIITHQRSLTSKSVPDFIEIRNSLIDEIEDKIQNKVRKSKSETHELNKTSKFKSMFSNIKNMTKIKMKPDKPHKTSASAYYRLHINRKS